MFCLNFYDNLFNYGIEISFFTKILRNAKFKVGVKAVKMFWLFFKAVQVNCA